VGFELICSRSLTSASSPLRTTDCYEGLPERRFSERTEGLRVVCWPQQRLVQAAAQEDKVRETYIRGQVPNVHHTPRFSAQLRSSMQTLKLAEVTEAVGVRLVPVADDWAGNTDDDKFQVQGLNVIQQFSCLDL
jgi:hypothetical protein